MYVLFCCPFLGRVVEKKQPASLLFPSCLVTSETSGSHCGGNIVLIIGFKVQFISQSFAYARHKWFLELHHLWRLQWLTIFVSGDLGLTFRQVASVNPDTCTTMPKNHDNSLLSNNKPRFSQFIAACSFVIDTCRISKCYSKFGNCYTSVKLHI